MALDDVPRHDAPADPDRAPVSSPVARVDRFGFGRTPSGRPIAPGGWRRGALGVTVGVLAGLAVLRGLDDGEA